MMVKNAKPKTKPYKLSDGGGLHLYVKPNGSRLWRFRYRFDEKEKTLSIGPFPLISLLEAREARDDAKRLLLEGIDPMVEKKKKKLTTIQNYQNTFKFVALDWYDNRKHIWSKRYADEVMKRLEADIFPEIGNYPITEIEPPVLLQVIRKIERRGAHELAKRQLQKCGEIFRYAIACGYGVRDPSRDIKEALKPVKNLNEVDAMHIALMKLKIKNESMKGRLLEIQRGVLSGRYVLKEDYEGYIFDIFRPIRDTILTIPDRLDAQIAVMDDKDEISELLCQELLRAMEPAEKFRPRI